MIDDAARYQSEDHAPEARAHAGESRDGPDGVLREYAGGKRKPVGEAARVT